MADLPAPLADRLARGPVVLDGAMGTELMARGLPAGAPPESWIIDRPHAIFGVHVRCAEAGADILYTCTFGANRLTLGPHGLGARVLELNERAADLALMAARPRGLLVMGSMGPTGGMLEPYGDLAPAHALAAFTEQARALVAAGVDGIVAESFTDPTELMLALGAARTAGARIIFATMAFEGPAKSFRTMMGAAPEEAAMAMRDCGAHALGLNCGGNPFPMATVMRRMHAAVPGVPLIAKPNAGLPGRVPGAGLAAETPDVFAGIVRDLQAAGAALLGGCCGTTPGHLGALREAVRAAAVPAAPPPTPPDAGEPAAAGPAEPAAFTVGA